MSTSSSSSGDWKGEILLQEDVWPGLDAEFDQEVENMMIDFQDPSNRSYSSSSKDRRPPRKLSSQFPSITIHCSSDQTVSELGTQLRDKSASNCSENDSENGASSNQSPTFQRQGGSSRRTDLFDRLRPRSVSPRPPHAHAQSPAQTQRGRGRSSFSGTPSAGEHLSWGSRSRSVSYLQGDSKLAADNVPCAVLIDLTS